jgi:multisubunit Na+/H+ antiporter MnhB subunit
MLEREAKRRYLIEMGAAGALYLVTLVISIRFGRAMEPGTGRTLLLLTPVIPVMLTVWALVRQFGRMDEFVRLRSLEAFSVAGAITAGLTLTYAFLETAGFPKLSMFWVWGIMGISWGAVSCWRSLFKR